jgi:hypothetical protein
MTIHIANTDIMLSPGMTSLGKISIGLGRIPFHGPTIGQSIGPRHKQSRVLRGITWNKSHNARLSILILSKAYPFHGILSHVTRLMKAYPSFSAIIKKPLLLAFKLLKASHKHTQALH